ncbi:N-acyl-phosphatidylethanolamine-hydrolyzing phospholipase D [Cystobacter fuscus]|uniref:N-acyl-phosphatidylethanolamine-hydrolyzing phospholipase D n=1 Tax=Cystobacter fuscus TaxID=43 RepID=A0A250JC24_9BACT|nr:MBL fold metallo-hydrolase [Cystobacter fuscus]ATB41108.1 N-acyl-phosphatidylethanolamine-hydrolyzing phospholipase D [Cystobacter fuscus]
MSDSQVYVKPNLVIEPLFNQWYAWSYLIPPATAAMLTANQHVKIMKSYVQNPRLHMAAVKQPGMLGGPVIDYETDRSADVRELLKRTQASLGDLIQLAEAIAEATALVEREAVGYSMDALYAKLPDCLRGFVELTYDGSNRPGLRLLEGLLYRSRYYRRDLQSLMLYPIEQDHRPFILSTPRLEQPDRLHLPLSFDHPGIDTLFRMQRTPGTAAGLYEALGVTPEQRPLVDGLLTPTPPRRTPRYDGDQPRVRYFGHACLLFESRETSILLDPFISYEYPSDVRRFSFQDLPDTIDYVVLTHNHQDHVLFEALLQLRHRVNTLVVPRGGGDALLDPSMKLMFKQLGFKNVVELEEMDALEIPGGSITGIPFMGEHGDLDIRSKIGHLINLQGRRALCVTDSANLDGRMYRHVHEAIGDVDTLFLGMECEGAPQSWLYGPLLTRKLERNMDQSRRLNGSDCQRGMELVHQFSARNVFIYAMGQEPWLNYVASIHYTAQSKPIVESDRLLAQCREERIAAERLFGHKEFPL